MSLGIDNQIYVRLFGGLSISQRSQLLTYPRFLGRLVKQNG